MSQKCNWRKFGVVEFSKCLVIRLFFRGGRGNKLQSFAEEERKCCLFWLREPCIFLFSWIELWSVTEGRSTWLKEMSSMCCERLFFLVLGRRNGLWSAWFLVVVACHFLRVTVWSGKKIILRCRKKIFRRLLFLAI